MFLNSFVCSKLTYSCQKWNVIVSHFEKLDVTYRNLLRKMDSSVLEVKVKPFDISLIIKKFMRYDAHPILAISLENSKRIMLIMWLECILNVVKNNGNKSFPSDSFF